MKSIAAICVTGVVACGGPGCSHGDSSGINPEATASHILVETIEKAEEIKAKFAEVEADGVAKLFAELAKEHSKCPSKENGGSLGHFESGQMVEEFEKVIFDQENQINIVHGPVETQFGQHLILIENRLNADGSKDGNVPVVKKATASHILVDGDDAEEKINSIKEQILAAEDQQAKFAELAAEHSKCPSGTQAGGNLGSFRQGQMVPEFDQVIFGADNALLVVHGPIVTQFGQHLIFITERTGIEEVVVVDEEKEVEVNAEATVEESVVSTEEESEEECQKSAEL